MQNCFSTTRVSIVCDLCDVFGLVSVSLTHVVGLCSHVLVANSFVRFRNVVGIHLAFY